MRPVLTADLFDTRDVLPKVNAFHHQGIASMIQDIKVLSQSVVIDFLKIKIDTHGLIHLETEYQEFEFTIMKPLYRLLNPWRELRSKHVEIELEKTVYSIPSGDGSELRKFLKAVKDEIESQTPPTNLKDYANSIFSFFASFVWSACGKRYKGEVVNGLSGYHFWAHDIPAYHGEELLHMLAELTRWWLSADLDKFRMLTLSMLGEIQNYTANTRQELLAGIELKDGRGRKLHSPIEVYLIRLYNLEKKCVAFGG